MAASSSSQAAPLAKAPSTMPEAASGSSGSSGSKKGIYFTNNMRDRQSRGKYTYVDESKFLWVMKQHHVTSRLQQEQQRQQQLQSLQSSQQQLARQSRDHQKLVEQKYVRIQKLLQELQQLQQQMQHAQLHQHQEQLQEMQHQHQQIQAKCYQLQLQYQEQVQKQKQLQEQQQFRKTGQHSQQHQQLQQLTELPTLATTSSTDSTETVPKAMMGGILARQANEQEDELPDDDLPSAVGYGPYWDALVEATVEFDPENFERTDPRRHAAAVLDTPELLMMYAQSMGDSIPATRLKFMRMMCGYDEEAGEHLTGGRSNEPVLKRICVRKSKSKDQDANGKFAHRRRRQNYT